MDDLALQANADTLCYTCPACGLLCDDLTPHNAENDFSATLETHAKGCQKHLKFYRRALKAVASEATPAILGKKVSLEEAIAEAAKHIKQAHHPLIAGLATDISGMRAVMNLAETANATLDHMNSTSSMRNLLTVQTTGWQITTFTEVKNRADVLLFVGTDVVSYYPRFFERMVWNKESMFGLDTANREIIFLGAEGLDPETVTAPESKPPQVLPCSPDKLPEVLAVLRAMVSGKRQLMQMDADVGGIALADLENIAEKLKAASYSVIGWSASALDFAHAELSIQQITGLIETLNLTTRSAGLPLSGSDGDLGAYNTSSWISGYPYRNSYRQGFPEYEPYLYEAGKLLADGEADLLLWINSLNPDKTIPGSETQPLIVIGHPDIPLHQLKTAPAVFIPVAIPGVDCGGTLFRSDSSVALPLRAVTSSTLPTLSAVLAVIETAL